MIVEAEKSQDLQLASWGHRRADGGSSTLFEYRDRTRPVFQFKDNQGEREKEFFLISPFCSTETSKGFEEAHAHWGGQSALFSLSVQMLPSSRNNLTDTPGNNV